jgi:hypothetical protein
MKDNACFTQNKRAMSRKIYLILNILPSGVSLQWADFQNSAVLSHPIFLPNPNAEPEVDRSLGLGRLQRGSSEISGDKRQKLTPVTWFSVG